MRDRDPLRRPPVTSCTGHSHPRARGRVFVVLALLAATAGCYRYAPAEPTAVAPESEIRVTLSDEGYRRVLPQAPSVGTQTVEGRFVALTDDTLVMSVWIGEAYKGTPFETTYQRVPLPRVDVVAVEDRKLSKWRTGVLAAGTVALIVTLIDQLDVIQIFGDSDPGPPEPPDPEGLIFRVRR